MSCGMMQDLPGYIILHVIQDFPVIFFVPDILIDRHGWTIHQYAFVRNTNFSVGLLRRYRWLCIVLLYIVLNLLFEFGVRTIRT